MSEHSEPQEPDRPDFSLSAASAPEVAAELADARRELKRLAQALERSEGRFFDAIERNADAIVVVGRDGFVRFANSAAEKLFGVAARDIVGTAFGFPVVDGETTELDLASGGGARVAEMRVVESEWDGRVAYIASLRDVTERKRAETDARRLAGEQAARRAAVKAARRFHFLADAGTLLTSSLDLGHTLGELARLCVAELADWAVVYCLDDDGRPRRLEAAHRDPSRASLIDQLRREPIDAVGAHPLLGVLESRRPLLIRSVSDAQLAYFAGNPHTLELLRELVIHSFMIVPMVAHDRALGAIALVCAEPGRSFDDDDVALAQDLAARAALAIDNARLFRESQRANQLKADFLAVLSHDLRTPLNAIIGYSELLMLGIPEPIPDAARAQVGRMQTSGKHLLYLIDQLLAYARLDAGHEDIRLEEVDVRAVVHEVVTALESLALERGLQLAADIPEGVVTCRTDPDKLRQVLMNLVANAIKYTTDGGVRVEMENVADRVAIRVRDTGVGVAPEHLEQIFQPFWQVDPSRRSRGGGTGLGLSVVRRLVELLGGDVSVESAPGVGSTFTVSLPCGGEPGHDGR